MYEGHDFIFFWKLPFHLQQMFTEEQLCMKEYARS